MSVISSIAQPFRTMFTITHESSPVSSVGKAIRAEKYKKALSLIQAGVPFPIIEQDGCSNIRAVVRHASLIKLTKELIQHADVPTINYSSKGESTALAVAAFYGNVEFVNLLAAAGGDVNVIDPKGDAVIIYALKGYNWNLALKPCASVSSIPFHKVRMRRSYETVRALVKHGAEIDVGNRKGQSPLAYHINDQEECIDLKLIAFFVKHGAIPVTRSTNLRTTSELMQKITEVVNAALECRRQASKSILGNKLSISVLNLVLSYDQS